MQGDGRPRYNRAVNRRLLLALLVVYVSLDLSLPAMPGAFVFEPGDSVESVHVWRGRGTTAIVLRPATSDACRVPVVTAEVAAGNVSPARIAPPAYQRPDRPRRVTFDHAPAPDDPH
jgi:hypothetical protein